MLITRLIDVLYSEMLLRKSTMFLSCCKWSKVVNTLLITYKHTREWFIHIWHNSRSDDFFLQWLFQPIQGLSLLFSSVIIFSQTVGLLGRAISSSQGLYLNIGKHKHRINAYTHTPNIHALSGIRTHDLSVRVSEDSSYLRPRGYCHRPPSLMYTVIIIIIIIIIVSLSRHHHVQDLKYKYMQLIAASVISLP
jgi:hypothetical protein